MIALLVGERQRGETSRAVQACNDWLRLGPGRSLPALLERYGKLRQNAAPTRSKNTLEAWSMRFGWAERAEIYDAQLEARKNRAAQRIMQTGLALTHRRVAALKRLARLLEQQLYKTEPDGTMPNLWCPDAKGIGSGDCWERVDLVRFNAALVDQLRGVLDDIAKEVGGRKQNLDVTTAGHSLFDLEAWQRQRTERRAALDALEEIGECAADDGES